MAKLLVVAVLATYALAFGKVSDIVPEETLLTQWNAPELEMDGAVVPAKNQANAVTGTENEFVAGACPTGTIRCADGVCAAHCTNTASTLDQTRYHVEFSPHPATLAAAPNIAAPPSAYENRAATLKAGEDAASFSAVTHAEVSQGLVDAAQDSKQAERAEEIAAEKAKVEVQFNTAAAKGGIYKQKSKEDDQAIVTVKQARLQEAEAAKEEKAAEAALKAAQEKRKKSQINVSNKEELERRAKYAAEYAGQTYEHIKTAAITADNALKEKEHEAAQEQRYRQVARAAVVAEAQKEASMDAKLMHQHKAPPALPKAPLKKEHSHKAKCSNCKTLPAEFSKKGGTCDDCDTWAKAGQCTQPTFKKFMLKYCAKSCNCPEEAAALIQLPEDAAMPESSVGPL